MEHIVKQPRSAGMAGIEAALGLDQEGLRRRRKRRRVFIAFAIASTVAVIGGSYFWFNQPAGKISYETATVDRSDILVAVSATGTLQPLTQVDISSELSGVVRTVAVAENERVTRGQVLAELDRTRLSAQVERAKASVQAAQARLRDAHTTLAEAEKSLSRSASLQARGMLADQALESSTAARDRADSAVASATADLAVANAELKLQEADLAKSLIYAPIDGIVLTRDVDPGQTVAASFSAPVLFVIAENLERMQLHAAIDEADIGAVAVGQKGSFTVDAFPERSFDTEIDDIAYASVTTEGVVTYEAKLAVDNEELLLRPGMTATVNIVTREANDVPAVPNAAFRFQPQTESEQPRRGWSIQNLFMPRFRRGRGGGNRQALAAVDGQRIVYVMHQGTPQPVPVQTGATDGDLTEIVSGLEVGSQVIVGATPAHGR